MTTEEFTGHVSAMRADNEFLGAEDLIGRGDMPVQIAKCNRCLNRKACGKSQPEMFTLNLLVNGKPAKKELWLKPTNRKQITKLYGANVSEWKNKWLWLYTDEVKSPTGGTTLGIRIRDRTDAPKQSAPQQNTDEVNWMARIGQCRSSQDAADLQEQLTKAELPADVCERLSEALKKAAS